jgi:hypothetical protein
MAYILHEHLQRATSLIHSLEVAGHSGINDVKRHPTFVRMIDAGVNMDILTSIGGSAAFEIFHYRI